MFASISRRKWLKSTALLTGGLISAPAVSPLLAGPTSPIIPPSIYERNLKFPEDMERIRVRLLANENAFGPSPMVMEAVRSSVEMGNRYGWDQAQQLTERIAQKEGVPTSHVLLGPGSSYLLEMTAIAHCQTKGNIVAADPTFMSLIRTAMAVGAKWELVPLTSDYAHDLTKMQAAVNNKTRLVYICNPNNPTGTLTPQRSLWDFCKTVSATTPVFVDEAYIEYISNDGMSQSMLPLVREGNDVIIARTFSKIRAMAGLRVGYIIAQPHRIKMIQDMVRPTMTLSVSSIMAAMASLDDDEFIYRSLGATTEARSVTESGLQELNLTAIPSVTNFMMFPIKMEGEIFIRLMAKKGVGVRLFQLDGKPWCRVSVGTIEDMQAFLKATREVTL
ncbi:MAG: histidinol-phosphate transaminase [Bacteroidota bacterium]